VVTPVVAGDAAAAELATESTDGITPATLDGASAEQKPTTRATTARRDSSGQTPIAPAATLGEGETPLGTDEANGVAADLADTASSGEQSQDGESAETSTKSPAAEQPTSTLAERAGRFMRNLNEASDKSPPKLSPADASRFVNRVSKAFEAAQHQDGIVRIRLSPPELGAMRIELSVQNGSLSARLETETSAARTVLLDNLPALRERLAEQQIRIDQFHVDVGGGQHDGAPDWQTAERDAQPRPGRAVQSAQQRETAQTHEAPQAPQIDSDGRFSAVA
jgi:flagellar hook-length control protein FliK